MHYNQKRRVSTPSMHGFAAHVSINVEHLFHMKSGKCFATVSNVGGQRTALQKKSTRHQSRALPETDMITCMRVELVCSPLLTAFSKSDQPSWNLVPKGVCASTYLMLDILIEIKNSSVDLYIPCMIQ